MPGTTPNRNYPFPQNPDRINVAGDIEALARAIDADVAGSMVGGLAAETAARIAADNALNADYIARDNNQLNVWSGDGNGGAVLQSSTRIHFQGGYLIVALDGFAHAEIPFPIPWRVAPIVIVNGAHPSMPQVCTIGGNPGVTPGSPVVSTTAFQVIAATPNGGSMANEVVIFNWLAMGFLP